ncbi:unnamed protein product [Symbiodinium natans]|uniref:Uncharacterized protein n=1 Tax=Symbiodinium natans TaxID=878477 RepID=A0A812N1D9_9DINO|nr:unnamed protein product [Symbiodinium natans]
MSESAPPRKAGWLDSDKDFHQFVSRMVQGAVLREYSDEQLWSVISNRAARHRLSLLQKCRGKEGRLDVTCFCREACGPEYMQLATCVRSSKSLDAGPELCQDQVAALTGCVRAEWKAFLMASSPSLKPDALERIEKIVQIPG